MCCCYASLSHLLSHPLSLISALLTRRCPSGSISATAFVCSSASSFCPPGSTSPRIIPPGYYGVGTDANTNSATLPCPLGNVCNNGLKVECARGRFMNETRKTVCLSCESGSYSSGGAWNCSSCAVGSYAAVSESFECLACAGMCSVRLFIVCCAVLWCSFVVLAVCLID